MFRVLITGSNGFIGKNLKLYLKERKDIEVTCFNKDHHYSSLFETVKNSNFIFHLAGVNRSDKIEDFQKGNEDFTKILCETVIKTNNKIPVVYTSSIKANQNTPYGKSKQNAEDLLFDLNKDIGVPVSIFRLPNVFGKWCKPNYNSVIATFCNNIIRDIPINISDKNNIIEVVYIDDVIKKFVQLLDNSIKNKKPKSIEFVKPVYKITLGKLANQLYSFKKMSQSKILEKVGSGLIGALYSTYVSYLPRDQFSSPISQNKDARGVFVEFLKTQNSGQFSYFTALPGSTRGSHYHHSKTEKFLIIKGKACFNFFHMSTGEKYELNVKGDNPRIVETIPGWCHSITNTGNEELIAMIWANEIYDPNNPDTFSSQI